MNVLADSQSMIDLKGAASDRGPEVFASKLPQHRKELSIPSGLVVSGDDSMRGSLGKALLLCGVAPVFATSIEQAAPDICAGDLRFVICQDTLRDGKYEDLLDMQLATGSSSPLIVVSPTGGWPEYFKAVDRGAYDFLAYPLIPGELQRIIRNFLDQPNRCQPPASFFFG
jgi:DNA-binding NtrC family response regulator